MSNNFNAILKNVHGYNSEDAKKKQRSQLYFREFTQALPSATIFTDGSSFGNPGPAGSGLVVYIDQNAIYHLSNALDTATNHYAELDGILQATIYLLQYPPENENIQIFVDNQLAVDLATGWRVPKTYEPLVREIKHNIKQLEQQSYTIHFFWVPAHVGIAGNEQADHLAKRGANGITSDAEPRDDDPISKPS